MALDPLEWIVIGVIVIVVFLWGPSKIPEIAKSIGLAKKEFDWAQKAWQNPTDSLLQQVARTPSKQSQSADDLLLQAARRMGISTEGKTRDQIAEEVVSARATPKNQSTPTQ
ncbi:MAG: twin-arginine translocase TatA/TatE family subunit [Nitrososphaerota archaeon]|nr:twin-arginine translocase TatA/TatE family subunit [Nitrososphaerota archaeon]